MKAVILAGGEGTRLRPLTLSTPKPVVPVVDRPLLQHQLDLLARAGVREVVFSVAYRPERVQAVLGDGRALGMHIRYAVEDSPLGTGGGGAATDGGGQGTGGHAGADASSSGGGGADGGGTEAGFVTSGACMGTPSNRKRRE